MKLKTMYFSIIAANIRSYSRIGRDCRAEQVENDQTLSQSNISLEKMML